VRSAPFPPKVIPQIVSTYVHALSSPQLPLSPITSRRRSRRLFCVIAIAQRRQTAAI